MLLAALLAVLWTYHAAAVEYFTLAATEVRAVSTDRPVLYSSNVDVVYRSAVRCTVTFDTPLHGFTAADIGAASTTVITGFSELSPNQYSFFVSSTVDANVSLSVAQGAARLWDPSVLGSIRYSDAEVPLLTFQFFRDPPSVSLRIDSQQGAISTPSSTRYLEATVWLIFSNTAVVDGKSFGLDQLSDLAVVVEPVPDPTQLLGALEKVSDTEYRFSLTIALEDAGDDEPECVDPAATAGSGYTLFACQACREHGAAQVCKMQVTQPPSNVANVEFPFKVVLSSSSSSGLAYLGYDSAVELPWHYDTLWAQVTMQAPARVKGESFEVNVSWSEPMRDLARGTVPAAYLPVFTPACAYTVEPVDASSYRLLVEPAGAATIAVRLAGSLSTADLAWNDNNFYELAGRATEAHASVVFARGADGPAGGAVSVEYARPTLRPYEYQSCDTHEHEHLCPGTCVWNGTCQEDLSVALPNASDDLPPSLTVSWTGFDTAETYDALVTWGSNGSLEALDVTSPHVFEDTTLLLGVEYEVCVRARNFWGDSTTACTVLGLPDFAVQASGAFGWMALPSTLGPAGLTGLEASVELLVRPNSFLSQNAFHVLALRAALPALAGGTDADPCAAAAGDPLLRCTKTNFHLEVPGTQFVLFKQALLLRLTFGAGGWGSAGWIPQLRYWNLYSSSWVPASGTCTPDKAQETWDLSAGVYTVSICHLSQFALFEHNVPYVPPDTTTAQGPERGESYDEFAFFPALAGVVAFLVFACGVCYWSCQSQRARRRVTGTEKVAYSDLGIRAIAERVPSQRPGGALRRPPGRPARGDRAFRKDVGKAEEQTPVLPVRDEEDDGSDRPLQPRQPERPDLGGETPGARAGPAAGADPAQGEAASEPRPPSPSGSAAAAEGAAAERRASPEPAPEPGAGGSPRSGASADGAPDEGAAAALLPPGPAASRLVGAEPPGVEPGPPDPAPTDAAAPAGPAPAAPEAAEAWPVASAATADPAAPGPFGRATALAEGRGRGGSHEWALAGDAAPASGEAFEAILRENSPSKHQQRASRRSAGRHATAATPRANLASGAAGPPRTETR